MFWDKYTLFVAYAVNILLAVTLIAIIVKMSLGEYIRDRLQSEDMRTRVWLVLKNLNTHKLFESVQFRVEEIDSERLAHSDGQAILFLNKISFMRVENRIYEFADENSVDVYPLQMAVTILKHIDTVTVAYYTVLAVMSSSYEMCKTDSLQYARLALQFTGKRI